MAGVGIRKRSVAFEGRTHSLRRRVFLNGGMVVVILFSAVCTSASDRCADARVDIGRAKALAAGREGDQARTLLRGALLACPMNPQNLELFAEVYDALGDFNQAGNFRVQAMRLRGTTSRKPEVTLTTPTPSIERGLTAEVSWTSQYATEVELTPDFGRVAATGGKTVAPSSTTSYQITAKGPGGSATATLEITVTTPRLTEANIVDLLRNGVAQARVAQLVNERGIKFEPAEEVQERLREAGADDAVIEAVKNAHH